MRTAADTKLLIELRRTAMDLLARREHSRAELLVKLRRKYAEASQFLSEVLDQLEQDTLLSDQRFAEGYVRYRRLRGFGPLLIRQELRNRGIDTSLLDAAVDPGADEWRETLVALITRKDRLFRSSDSLESDTDAKGVQQNARKFRQKLYRFCLSRGFTSEQIDRALRSYC